MHRLQIASLLALLVLFSGNAYANGNELLRNCQSALALERGGQSPTDSARAIQCLGYLQGFSGLNALYEQVQQKTFWCLPDGVRNEQIVRVVVKYLQSHPELLHQSKAGLAALALGEAFPCND